MCKDGLKQPDRIKILFTMNGKEVTSSIPLNQSCFSLEFFLTQMLPNFKLKDISHLPPNKQCEGQLLFPLMEQCSQEVGLTEWMNVVSAHCPDKESKMFENLVDCKQDYLEALAGFLNICNQLIHWFHTAQNLVLMPTHD